MSKYRIKVYPAYGKLVYMPQRKFLWFWLDVFETDYNHLFTCSESQARWWINYTIEKERLRREKRIKDKNFERDTPTNYIYFEE